jgi:hypothetical protein
VTETEKLYSFVANLVKIIIYFMNEMVDVQLAVKLYNIGGIWRPVKNVFQI